MRRSGLVEVWGACTTAADTDASDDDMTDSSPDPETSPTPRVDAPAGRSVTAGGGRLEVSGTQVAASVLASVSAAVIASFFGVAGTIVGAGVVSVVATIGSAAYSLGIRRTQHRIHKLQELRPTRSFPSMRAQAERAPAAEVDAVDDAVGDLATAEVDTALSSAAAADGGWRGWLAERRWGVAAGVALVFVISLASVTLLELAGNRTLSRESGGSARTSIGALVFGDGGSGGTGEPDMDTDTGDSDGGDPATTSETVPGDTTTSLPGGTTSTTATDSGAGGADPAGPSTSTTSTTSPPAPSTTSTTVPDRQGDPPPVPTTAEPAPAG